MQRTTNYVIIRRRFFFPSFFCFRNSTNREANRTYWEAARILSDRYVIKYARIECILFTAKSRLNLSINCLQNLCRPNKVNGRLSMLETDLFITLFATSTFPVREFLIKRVCHFSFNKVVHAIFSSSFHGYIVTSILCSGIFLIVIAIILCDNLIDISD